MCQNLLPPSTSSAQSPLSYVQPIFFNLAQLLLQSIKVHINQESYTIHEVEFYLYNQFHPDPFVHRNEPQISSGQWYFHKHGRGYRGGSFKGLDITFGGPHSYGGILLRTLQTSAGQWICGPSLVVDHLIQQSSTTSVRALAEQAQGAVWDQTNVIHLKPITANSSNIWTSARVGLKPDRWRSAPPKLKYLAYPYRYLNAPGNISKGRPHFVLGAISQGHDLQTISKLCRSRPRTVDSWISAYNKGLKEGLPPILNRPSTSSMIICQVIGACRTADSSLS